MSLEPKMEWAPTGVARSPESVLLCFARCLCEFFFLVELSVSARLRLAML